MNCVSYDRLFEREHLAKTAHTAMKSARFEVGPVRLLAKVSEALGRRSVTASVPGRHKPWTVQDLRSIDLDQKTLPLFFGHVERTQVFVPRGSGAANPPSPCFLWAGGGGAAEWSIIVRNKRKSVYLQLADGARYPYVLLNETTIVDRADLAEAAEDLANELCSNKEGPAQDRIWRAKAYARVFSVLADYYGDTRWSRQVQGSLRTLIRELEEAQMKESTLRGRLVRRSQGLFRRLAPTG